MIASKEYKNDLIKFADKLRYKAQSFPKDENGTPTETYLEYISMMYDPEIIKIALELDVFPKMTSLMRLSKKTGINKIDLQVKIEPVAKRGFIIKMGPQLCLPTPLFVYDLPFILKENYTRDDFAVLEIVNDILKNYERFNIYNKKQLYVYIREATDLPSRKITKSLKKIKLDYFSVKEDFIG